MKPFEKLTIDQLDRDLQPLKHAFKKVQNYKSWISIMRNALKMSTYDLANRIGISQSTIISFEHNEIEGKITLESLQKTAEAMGCEVIYAFIPHDSLNSFIDQQMDSVIQDWIKSVNQTMRLEAQELNERQIQQQEIILREELTKKSLRALWKKNEI
ncbi:MAG: mobile mystery protein A [Proteobacteria bacterium]|nr:mobile mystery protein A [Pseudomonadota bacterium]